MSKFQFIVSRQICDSIRVSEQYEWPQEGRGLLKAFNLFDAVMFKNKNYHKIKTAESL